MKSFQQQAEDLLKKVEELKLGRRKVLILCGTPLCGKTLLAREACKQANGTYTDVSLDLLPKITSPVLGAYGPDDFFKWIRDKARSSELLCVDEIEPLLSTFGEEGVRRFFRMLGSIEPKKPAVVITRLTQLVESSGFPDDRIFRVGGRHGQE